MTEDMMDKIYLRYQIILISLALAGSAILFLFLYFPGLGVSPDSVYYFSVARNIYIGNGLTGYDGYPLILQPPLYPVLLLILKIFLHLNLLTTAGLFNALLFGGTIYTSGLLLKKYLHSFVLVITGIFLIITSPILLKVFLNALSEPLFIFLSLLTIYLGEEYFTKKSLRLLLLLSSITAAAIMTRYIGIILFAGGIIRFLIDKEKFSKKKFYRMIFYAFISLLPISIWMIRNFIISQTLMGSRAASSFTPLQNILLTFKYFVKWFQIPDYFNGYLILIEIFISLLFVLVYLFNRKNQNYPEFKVPSTLVIYIIIYFFTLVITSSLYAYDRIGDRLLSPIYILLIIFLITAADKLLIKHFNFIKIFAAAGILVFMNFSLQNSFFLIDDYLNKSGWEYSSNAWTDNSVIQSIKKMDMTNCRLYSNAPDAVYFFTKKETGWSPLRTFYNSEITVNKYKSLYEIKQKGEKYLIWFDKINRPFLYSKAELISLIPLKKISESKDGEVFLIIN